MKQVRIGLVGCGVFGEGHLRAFRAVPEARITALFDTDRTRAEQVAREFEVDRVCRSLEELCASPEVDAVDVVTPEHLHLDPVLCAFGHGKDVFVEKPLATDLDECARMINDAAARRRILMVGQIVRFEIRAAMLKEEVASGGLGKIVSMHARRNRLKTLLDRYARNHPCIENAIHDVDLMLWYTGDRVRRVRGYQRNATGSVNPETFWGILEFEGGAIGVLQTIWLLPKAAGVVLDDAFQVFGDKGAANVSFFPGGLSFWRETGFEIPDTSYRPWVFGAAHGALRDELAYFCGCARERKQPEVITAREAKNAVRVALALIDSATAGRDAEITDWD